MRTLSLAAIFALAAIPVSAQQADQQKNQSPVEQMEKQSRQVQTPSERQNQQQSQQSSAMSQQKLRSALEEAGFKQINIIDSAYLVRAQTEDGNNVVLYIDPPAAGQQQSDADLPEGSFKTDSIRQAEQDRSGSN